MLKSSELISHKMKRLSLFLLVTSLHLLIMIGIIFFRTNKSIATGTNQTLTQLTFITLPKALPNKVVSKSPDTVIQSIPISKPFVPTQSKVISELVVESADIETNTHETKATNLQNSLILDVKGIALSMKKEFDKGDRLKGSNQYDAFHSSLSSHNGTQIKQVFGSDGRPISKVTTPYGTYCLRHYKPGEKLELTPPSYAVSCGSH